MQYFSFFTTQLSIIVLTARTMVSSNKQAEYPNMFSGKFRLTSWDWKISKICSTWVFISFCKRSFQKNPTMRSITRLQLSVIIECFDFQVFVKASWLYKYSRALLGLKLLSSIISPIGSFFVHQSWGTRVKYWKKCVQKGTFFWKPLLPYAHLGVGKSLFPLWIGNFWLDCKLFLENCRPSI